MPVHEIADDDASSRKDRRARGEFQYDQDGQVTHGRVPMMLRDSAMRDADRREVQRQIKADAARREVQRQIADRQRVVDGAGNDGVALHRPGSRMLADRSAYDAVADSYDEMCRASEVAWKAGPGQQLDADPPPTAFGSFEPHRLGQTCTLNGADGRLEASADGKWLICRPIAQRNDSAPAGHPSLSLADGERIKEEAYLARVRNGEEAWKNLGRS